MALSSNLDVESDVESALAATSAEWVLDGQQVSWQPAAWRRQWMKNPQLPHIQVLDELASELDEHKRIRRRFVFGYAAQNAPLLIGAMAWGYGNDNRGPARARQAITQGEENLDAVIGEVRDQLFSDGVAAAFKAMFRRNQPRIPQCNTAFVTKILHFTGYESHLRPRPLIYDQNVAAALARIPSAPTLPDPLRLTADQYQYYCQWAEDTGHPPIVVEYALFKVGGKLFR